MYKGFLLSRAGALFLASTGASSLALAQTTVRTPNPAATVEAQSVTQTSTTETRFTDKLTIGYWGNLAGPGVGDSSYTPTVDGVSGDPVTLNSHLTLGYKPTETTLVGAVVETDTTPVRDQEFTLKDPYLKLGKTKLIDSGGLKLGVDGRFYAPLSQASKDNSIVTAVRLNQNLTYDIPDTRFTIASYTFVKKTVYSGDGTGTDLQLYWAPYANYQFSSKVGAVLWVDAFNLKHKRGNNAVFDMAAEPWDVQPGINWDVSDNLSLNPYLNFYPDNLTLASTYVGMIVTAKLL